jgi:hypothetical protein
LVNGFPEFRCELDGVAVREVIKPAAHRDGLIRSFEIDHPGRDVWFVAGEHPLTEIVCSAGPFEQGRVKVSAGGNARFEVTVLAAQKRE